jgi:hypothetical protein
MLEELQRRTYADGTIRHCLQAAEEFAHYFGKPPTSLLVTRLQSFDRPWRIAHSRSL